MLVLVLTMAGRKEPHAASGWRIHCGVEVTELSTNKQHTLSNVLIVSVLLPTAIDLGLRSNMQRRVDVLRACHHFARGGC
jgi:hypothetical protein